MPIPLGILAAAGFRPPTAAGAYELIETITVGSGGAASVTFSNLNTYSSTYQHLQIRAVARGAQTGGAEMELGLRINGITTNSYSWHILRGNGSTVTSAAGSTTNVIYAGNVTDNTAASNIFGAAVIDILDPYETSKFKTIKSMSGQKGATATTADRIGLYSGLFQSTDAISSITLLSQNLTSGFLQYSRFSIYGIRGN